MRGTDEFGQVGRSKKHLANQARTRADLPLPRFHRFARRSRGATMPTPDATVSGGPVWVDVLTTDADSARAFYGELLGWSADAGNPEFGGYFNFLRDGAFIAGGMAYQPGMPAEAVPNVWSVYLRTEDAAKTVAAAVDHGGRVIVGPMPVGDLGVMAVVADSTGAVIGMWQPGLHTGFATVGEPGAPAWFELWTGNFAAALDFYREVFGWRIHVMSNTPEFRYATLVNATGEPQAGIMDASTMNQDEVTAAWSVYFAVTDADAALEKIAQLGGKVLRPAEDTPYGRLAEATDATGVAFKLMGPNKG